MGKLFLLFTLVPLLDLWVLVRLGDAVGWWPTLALVILTGVAGAWLARAEGLRVLRAWRAALSAGRLPEEGVLSGVLVLVGAALLVTPGVITDAAGLALLLPPTRRLAAAGLRRWLERQAQTGHVRVFTVGPGRPWGDPRPSGDEDEIDVTPRGPRRSDAGSRGAVKQSPRHTP